MAGTNTKATITMIRITIVPIKMKGFALNRRINSDLEESSPAEDCFFTLLAIKIVPHL
jgi:hypothetical protein